MSLRHAMAALGTALVAACSSAPPAPDWQVSANSQMKLALSAYLTGDNRVADLELARVRGDVARTGRPDLAARVELVRCAAQVASLDYTRCSAFERFEVDAAAAERAYAAMLYGAWPDAQAFTRLPPHHQALLSASKPAEGLSQMADPLGRLVAAGVLFRVGKLTPAEIAVATETASQQGWRRPLLAWLGVQLALAEKAGEQEAMQRIRRRIALAATP